jgi:hypothetical protein
MPRARTTARASRTASTASAIRSTLPRNSSTTPFLHRSLRLRDRGSNRVSDTDAFTSRPSRPAFVPRTTGRRQGTTGTAGAANPQVREPDSGIGAGSETGPENTLKEDTAHLLLIPTRRVWQGRISLIRWLRPTRAIPRHPPNGIGDGGQLDAREDLSPRSATYTTSSLVPEGKPLLQSAWPEDGPATSSCPPRPIHDRASCR